MQITPKNWSEFQHYKHRNPPWIRLYGKLLDDYEYHCLPIASKALAPFLWLLASEFENGRINMPYSALLFRLRISAEDFQAAIAPLISSMFFTMSQDDSEMLATCKQDATTEKSRVEKEKETNKEKESPIYSEAFTHFWSAYPNKTGKGAAWKSWQREVNDPSAVMAALEWQCQSQNWIKENGKYIPMPATYLNQRRWEDEPADSYQNSLAIF